MPKRGNSLKNKDGLTIPSGAKQYLSFDDQGAELWEIENILDQRVVNGKKEYMVKWRGWPIKYCTWEDESSFLEDMGAILKFLEEFNGPSKRVYKPIQKKEKPEEAPVKKKPVRKAVRKTKHEDVEAALETKIVIQKFTVPTAGNTQENEPETFWTCDDNNPVQENDVLPLNNKLTEVFVCTNTNDETTTQMMTDENDMNGPNPNNDNGFFWGSPKQDENRPLHDSDDELDEGYSNNKRREEMEDDRLAEMISCPFQIKSLNNGVSAPLMENELDKLEDYRVMIEECFTFSKGGNAQPGSFRFKVAFYDKDNNLKGFDYFSYDEIQQKKWGTTLLDFFTKEILSEMARNKKSLTKNIKVI